MKRGQFYVKPEQVRVLKFLVDNLPERAWKGLTKEPHGTVRTNYNLVKIMVAATAQQYPEVAPLLEAAEAVRNG